MTARLLAAMFAALICFASIPVLAANPPALLTGAAFRKELDGIVDIVWKDKRSLRPALEKLGETKQIAIILDRRVDPDQQIEFTVADVSLEQALRQLASRLKLGVTFFDSTVYIGPEGTCRRLATFAAVQHDKAMQAPDDRKSMLRSIAAEDVSPLSAPRELLNRWATTTGVNVQNVDKVPHDLWPAIRYPQQTAATRAMLFLAGFDLAIEFSHDGTLARVIPMPEQVSFTRTYPGGTNPKNRGEQIAKQFPTVDVKTEGSQLVISGSFEDHDYIARLLRGETIRRTEVGRGEKRYTLSVENKQLGAVARAIAEQVKLQVEFDEAIRDKEEALVSFNVKDVTLEDLFKAMLAPQGLDFLMLENKIRIMLKK